MTIEIIITLCILVIIAASITVFVISNREKAKFKNNTELHDAVTSYLDYDTRKQTAEKYGKIETWDTSKITNMKELFSSDKKNAETFNADISGWDTGNVTTMERMFKGAKAFNQPIGKWNVSSVTNMKGMFDGAFSFNADITNWDVNNVKNMRYMFRNAKRFDKDVIKWRVGGRKTDAFLIGTKRGKSMKDSV